MALRRDELAVDITPFNFEINPFKVTRAISWRVLHLTHTAGLAQSALELLVPSEYAKSLLRNEEERRRQEDKDILLGVGKLALRAKRDLVDLGDADLDSVWAAVVQGDAGVEVEEVFDPHSAECLRRVTPALAGETAPQNKAQATNIPSEI
jgi:hypothetical protein